MPDSRALREREALRADWVSRIPPWYNPWVHLLVTTSLGVGFSALAVAQIHGLRPLQLLVVPAVWVFSNAIEWRAHRDLLHKLEPWAKPLYVQHTLQHHRLYFTEDMEIRDSKELRMVLMPSFGMVLILLTTLPLAAALWSAGGHNLAALFIVTSQLYVVSYEWLHMSYHLPRRGFIGRRWLVRKLGRHHAIHHAPERMNRWNMNVNFPFWDWVRGSIYRGEAPQASGAPTDLGATHSPPIHH
jgi:sterol desaturase/sphingolipid hydroxylase (fatty acid hydroxylase superfamily)